MANRKNVTGEMEQVIRDYLKSNDTVCEYAGVQRVREVLELAQGGKVSDSYVHEVFCKVTGYRFATYVRGGRMFHEDHVLINMVTRLVNAMDDEFASLTDIAKRAGLAHTAWDFTQRDFPYSVTKCVQYLAEHKYIEGLEIKTCGRVAIRLYRVR